MRPRRYTEKRNSSFMAIQWNGFNDTEIINFVGEKSIKTIDHEHKIIVIGDDANRFCSCICKGDYVAGFWKINHLCFKVIKQLDFEQQYERASV